MQPSQKAPKCWQIWRKWRFWQIFAKVEDEILRANKLTQLEGPRNVGEFGENGEFGKSGDFVNVGEKIISDYI